jgi:tetratricopeptide (TPR) repeat protein
MAMVHKKRDRRLPGLTPRQVSESPRPETTLATALQRAENLLLADQAQEAVDLLRPLAERHTRRAEVHSLLGRAYFELGELYSAVAAWERASELTRDIELCLALASTYAALGLFALSLREHRRLLRSGVALPDADILRQHTVMLEEQIAEVARQLQLPVQRTEEGLASWDRATLALRRGDYRECISLNRKAIARLGDWPPAYNNLAVALYRSGQPAEAIATVQRVLARQPDNLHALCNGTHFLVWTGRVEEARALWPRLEHLNPEDSGDRVKLAMAAADLERDADVYRLLYPVANKPSGPGLPPNLQLHLAVAEANLGRRGAARRRLTRITEDVPWAKKIVAALKAGKPGPGLAQRFPYTHCYELVPVEVQEQLFSLMDDRPAMAARRFQQRLNELVARFPQIVLMAEKMIWEEDMVSNGIALLDAIGTPAAYAALKRFGFSQSGEDQQRLEALQALAEVGEVSPGQPLRAWLRGEWREVTLRRIDITEPARPEYTRQATSLLERAEKCLAQGDDAQAEQLLWQALEAEPRAIEAYNNLGVIYGRRQDYPRAQEMYHRALEIKPDYVFARANLAIYLLGDDDVDEAEAMLKPLATVAQMTPTELAFLQYVQARCLVVRERYDEAQTLLETALDLLPDYEKAEELLRRVELLKMLQIGSGSFWDKRRERQATARRRLQSRITRLDPSLREVVELYSKDVLTGAARAVMVYGGWSSLKKADLINAIVANQAEPEVIEFVTVDLEEEDLAALRDVLLQGGAMPWQEFEARYGNDLEESPYWNYHTPETVMGRLRQRLLLAEATVDGMLYVCIPAEVRQELRTVLGLSG